MREIEPVKDIGVGRIIGTYLNPVPFAASCAAKTRGYMVGDAVRQGWVAICRVSSSVIENLFCIAIPRALTNSPQDIPPAT